MSQLILSCFGTFQASLDLDGERLTGFHSVKVQALLAYLALEADCPHPRETLATLLWPLDSETSARNSLRQALYELRKTLGDRDDSPVPFLLVTRQTVQFNRASDHTIDVADFLAHIKRGQLTEAAECYRGELLNGLSCESEPFEEWLRQTRAHFHNLALDLFFKLTEQHMAAGELVQARSFVQRQLALEPWREEAHRQLITIMALGGERSAALAQYETCCRILASELGVAPDAETVALYDQIKAGNLRGRRADPFPSLANLAQEPTTRQALSMHHNLPPQPTPFIGRKTDLAQIIERLRDTTCRLLTIVGPGGMGKTRLAVQAAQSIVDLSIAISDGELPSPDSAKAPTRTLQFEEGIFFVALAGVASPDLLVSTLATTLDFTAYGSADPQTQLFDYLKSRSLLLVFDNFEHLVDGAELVSDLLAAAPRVKVLVTSREALRLQEEWLHPLSGMSFPTREAAASGTDGNGLEQYTAVQLFVQRANQVKAGFDLVAQGSAVAQICRLVEGMPLGIELAAAWLRFYGCAQIAQEIARNLDFLATPLRNVPARHRSMRAVFSHSWQLLAEDAQRVFAQLSVFRGGFLAEAEEQLAPAPVPILLGLVEKSLLQLTPAGRFQLHELLRQFAEEKLTALPQELAQAQERHCLYYLALLQQQEVQLKGRHQAATVAVIEAEIENIRVAWHWAIAQQQIDAIDGCLESLYIFYVITSGFKEGAVTLGQAAEALALDVPTGRQGVLYGKLLARRGHLLVCLVSQVESGSALEKEGEALSQQSVAILTHLGASEQTGLALTSKSGRLRNLGQYDDALDMLEQALAIFTRQGDHWGMSQVLHDLGFTSYCAGDYHRALHYFQEAIAICNAMGNLKLLGDNLNMVGEVHKVLGDYAAGQRATEAALTARTTAGDKRGIAWSLQLLGELGWLTGDYALAERHSQESFLLFQQIRLTKTQGAALNVLGEIASSRGNYQQAKAYFQASLVPFLEPDTFESQWIAEMTLVGLGTVLVKEGKITQAAELLTHVLSIPSLAHEPRERAATLLAELAGQLPTQDLAAAQKRAETQTISAFLSELLTEAQINRASV